MTWEYPKIEHNKLTKYNYIVSYPENLYLDYGVDIGEFTYIQAEYDVSIGYMTKIGGHCLIYSKNTENGTNGVVLIGNNVKIGSHSLILPGSIIPGNSKIKAYSIVKPNKDGITEIHEMVRKVRNA